MREILLGGSAQERTIQCSDMYDNAWIAIFSTGPDVKFKHQNQEKIK